MKFARTSETPFETKTNDLVMLRPRKLGSLQDSSHQSLDWIVGKSVSKVSPGPSVSTS